MSLSDINFVEYFPLISRRVDSSKLSFVIKQYIIICLVEKPFHFIERRIIKDFVELAEANVLKKDQ